MEPHNNQAGTDASALMAQAAAGDQAAFATVYERYFTPVYRYIYFRVRSRHEAEDIAQTVFMKAFSAIGRYQERGKEPLAYFFTIARNAVINYWRTRRTTPMSMLERLFATKASEEPEPDEVAIDAEEGAGVREALATLTEEQQEAITLRFMGERSNAEIAQLMGKSEEAVRQLHSRGLRALREAMVND